MYYVLHSWYTTQCKQVIPNNDSSVHSKTVRHAYDMLNIYPSHPQHDNNTLSSQMKIN